MSLLHIVAEKKFFNDVITRSWAVASRCHGNDGDDDEEIERRGRYFWDVALVWRLYEGLATISLIRWAMLARHNGHDVTEGEHVSHTHTWPQFRNSMLDWNTNKTINY